MLYYDTSVGDKRRGFVYTRQNIKKNSVFHDLPRSSATNFYDAVNGSMSLNASYHVTSNVTGNESTDVIIRHGYPGYLYHFRPSILLLMRVPGPIWYCIGFPGNLVSLVFWLRKPHRHLSLAALAACDLLFLTLHMVHYLDYAWGVRPFSSSSTACAIVMLLTMLPQYLLPLLVFSFTLRRFLSICRPLRRPHPFCRPKVLLPSLVFTATVFATPQAYFWRYDVAYGVCQAENSKEHEIYTWITEVLFFFITPIVILILDIRVLKEAILSRIREKRLLYPPQDSVTAERSKQSTRRVRVVTGSTCLIAALALYHVLTTFPTSIIYILVTTRHLEPSVIKLTDYEIEQDSKWQTYLNFMVIREVNSSVIFVSNAACNVFIYLLFSRPFRAAARKLFRHSKRRSSDPYHKSVSLRRLSSEVSFLTRGRITSTCSTASGGLLNRTSLATQISSENAT